MTLPLSWQAIDYTTWQKAIQPKFGSSFDRAIRCYVNSTGTTWRLLLSFACSYKQRSRLLMRWQRRMGVEPTRERSSDRATVLKTARPTGTRTPPWRAVKRALILCHFGVERVNVVADSPLSRR